MTSKLKCPVCQNNLHKINVVVSTCTNDKCKLWGSSIPNLVLEALAQAKQDLEIATKALEEVRDETGEDRAGFSYVILAANMKETAEKALETIGKHNE